MHTIPRTARVLYLYPDAHGILIHQRKDRDVGMMTWATGHQRFLPRLRLPSGRLVINREAIPLVAKAKELRVQWSEGTTHTRNLGVRALELELDFGLGLSIFHLVPGLISSDILWQDGAVREEWKDLREGEEWGLQRLSRLFPLPSKAA